MTDTHLTEAQRRILREKATEPPFSGALLHTKEQGTYHCAACRTMLFRSSDKFDSGTGWPSFADAVQENIELKDDRSHGMARTEVLCKTCHGHLGHLFDDGPAPSRKRYCINSLALTFEKK